jgi:2-polyprenyl-6-methoxyphenol hydroxylase-like FAD-dependent oxidoreductase
VLAYWLARRGFETTVVERAPTLRKTGGHAVDLFRPAMNISEQMGVVDRIEARATGTKRLIVDRGGGHRRAVVDYDRLMGTISDRHVEIMRDDLSQIYFDAGRDDVEYVFGDEITGITPEGDVAFASGPSRRFDIVVGADGLHSGVRQLIFGPEAGHTRFLDRYLAVLSVPKSIAREGDLLTYLDVDRLAGIYTADHLDDARVVFIFRTPAPLTVGHRDTAGQKAALESRFASMAPEVDRWLSELDAGGAFYFDSITQLSLTSWSRGRVTLVGDAGYCPGPAVGGSTSLAVLGAYVLAGELHKAGDDFAAGFAAYERVMSEPVQRSRTFARNVSVHLVPSSPWRVWALTTAARAVSVLPAGPTRALARLNQKGVRLYDSMSVPDY